MQYYPLVNENSSTLLSIQHNESLSNSLYYFLTDLERYLSALYATISVNGSTLTSNPRKFNLSHTIRSSNLMNELNYEYNATDEGLYSLLLYTYSDYILRVLYPFLSGSSCLCYSFEIYSHASSLNILYLSLPIHSTSF